MDKAQKSLVDTYFRKRKIAGEQDSRYKYYDYETAYLVINDMYDVSKVTHNDMVSLIIHQPKVITKFDLSELNDMEIMEILFEHHNLIDYFKPYLSKITSGGDIKNVILTLGEYDLTKYFDLSKLKKIDITHILVHRPELIDVLKPYIDDLNAFNIITILKSQPKLIDSLKLELYKLNEVMIYGLLLRYPQLKPYFDNIEPNG